MDGLTWDGLENGYRMTQGRRVGRETGCPELFGCIITDDKSDSSTLDSLKLGYVFD